MLHTSDFDFELPPELIASHPLARRDASRMLVVEPSSPPLDGCPQGGVGAKVPLLRRGGRRPGWSFEAGKFGANFKLPFNKNLVERARKLRKAGSLPEALLWKEIKGKQVNGLNFDRQKVIGNYIVDFFCPELGIVIEIDDKTHDFKAEYDKARDEYLKSLHLNVIHVSAADVLKNPHGIFLWLSNHPGTSCHPSTGGELTLSDKHIRDFLDYLRPGDVVVFNNSRVIPARFDADGHEITLHTAVDDKNWWGLCKKFNKINIGDTLTMADGTTITVMDKDDESGLLLRFNCDNVFDVLNRVGKMPLPPYMKRDAEIADQTRYQTVYADPLGSMAAPTAGLHFTDELMAEIEKRGAKIVKITLHVGAGTWMPVKTENLSEHKMHSEWCQITPEQADIINTATRVIAVGTTTLRTLESAALAAGSQSASAGDARCGGGSCQPRLCGGVAECECGRSTMRGRVDMHHQYRSENLKNFSVQMRQHMTDAEKKLWYAINNKKLGFQFRRQYIIDNKYIADFICLEKKLIIEVDGSQHIENPKDGQRTQYLQQFGFNVVRFWNWDINENLDGCLQVIIDILTNDSFERRLVAFKEKFGPAPGSVGVELDLADPAARAGLTPAESFAPNAGSQSASAGDARCGGGLNRVAPFCGTTDIFITPGYKFRAVDVLLTNFHLPKSTLFMLVSAFSGLAEMKAAYAHAVAEKYRFFSYGDCCLLFRKEDQDEI